MNSDDAVLALTALAQQNRLAIFRHLVACGPSGESAGNLARAVHIGPTRLSFHVKELARAGLVHSWRNGRSIRYAVQIEVMRRLLEFLASECCGGHPELCGGLVPANATHCDT